MLVFETQMQASAYRELVTQVSVLMRFAYTEGNLGMKELPYQA